MFDLHTTKFHRTSSFVGDSKLSFLAAGNKENPIILLLHGWGGRASLLSHLGQHLARTHYVLIPDLPGFGDSSPLKKARFEEIANLLVRWLETKSIKKFSIIGHSMGGGIGVEISLLAPTRTEKILLLSSALNPIQRTIWQWVGLSLSRGFEAKSFHVIKEVLKIFYSLFLNFFRHPVWMVSTYQMTTRSNLLKDLRKIDISPTVMCADDEWEFLPAINKVCRILLVKPILLKGSGHNWPLAEPHQAASLIENYL